MRLPPDSEIPEDKILRYLLLPRREDDKSKFLARAGYTLANWEQLMEDLRRALRDNDARASSSTPYGEIYELRAIYRTERSAYRSRHVLDPIEGDGPDAIRYTVS